jgi:hypothetical protein
MNLPIKNAQFVPMSEVAMLSASTATLSLAVNTDRGTSAICAICHTATAIICHCHLCHHLPHCHTATAKLLPSEPHCHSATAISHCHLCHHLPHCCHLSHTATLPHCHCATCATAICATAICATVQLPLPLLFNCHCHCHCSIATATATVLMPLPLFYLCIYIIYFFSLFI